MSDVRTAPVVLRPATVLPADRWQEAQAAHATRADELTAGRRSRAARGEKHPVEDFLHDYYGVTPAALRRWHPGVGLALEPGPEGPAPHAARRWYRTDGDGVVGLDVEAYLAERGSTVAYVRGLLEATASRPAMTGCFGLHEWAMVYRQDPSERRHTLPLRLGAEGTNAVVESHALRCTHMDAFRFFTPDAVGRNAHRLTREDQPAFEQPGCLHATMDLTKWCLKLGPAVSGDLLLDCVDLTVRVRRLDMQASPYDLSALGEPAVAVETPAGKAEYVARQRAFAEEASGLRARVLEVCAVLGSSHLGG